MKQDGRVDVQHNTGACESIKNEAIPFLLPPPPSVKAMAPLMKNSRFFFSLFGKKLRARMINFLKCRWKGDVASRKRLFLSPRPCSKVYDLWLSWLLPLSYLPPSVPRNSRNLPAYTPPFPLSRRRAATAAAAQFLRSTHLFYYYSLSVSLSFSLFNNPTSRFISRPDSRVKRNVT